MPEEKPWHNTAADPPYQFPETDETRAAIARLKADGEARAGMDRYYLTQLGAPAAPAARRAFNERLAIAIAIGAGAPYVNVDSELAAMAAGGLRAVAAEFCRAWWRPDAMLSPGACLRLCLSRGSFEFLWRLKHSDQALALGGGDFTEIMADSTNRIFQGWAPTWAPSWERIGATRFVDRWDPVRTFFMQPHPSLPEIPEGASFESVRGIADTGTTYTMHRYGALWHLTQAALLGDDRDALSRPVLVFGSAAFATEDDKFWGIITGNDAMDDGVALFDAAHGNVATPAALSAESLTAARNLLLAQVAASGESLRLKAKHLIVPVSLSATAAALLKTLGNDTAEPQDRLTLTVEPRLDVADTKAWYLACDPQRHPLAEVAFLRGARQPRVTSMWSFNDDALKAKISHVFGCRVVDHRGWIKNLGA